MTVMAVWCHPAQLRRGVIKQLWCVPGSAHHNLKTGSCLEIQFGTNNPSIHRDIRITAVCCFPGWILLKGRTNMKYISIIKYVNNRTNISVNSMQWTPWYGMVNFSSTILSLCSPQYLISKTLIKNKYAPIRQSAAIQEIDFTVYWKRAMKYSINNILTCLAKPGVAQV